MTEVKETGRIGEWLNKGVMKKISKFIKDNGYQQGIKT